jgi:hypothetical protein
MTGPAEDSRLWLDDANPACLPPMPEEHSRGFLTGNRNFPNFIGFMSNPVQNIDPRAVTELWPVFGNSWVSAVPAVPKGQFQVYGAGLYLALSERLSIGLTQGGYAATEFSRTQVGPFLDNTGRLRDRREFGGDREGWLNLGGFVQYTLIEDVPRQFLLTTGLRWEAPSGSSSVFQGQGPAHLAPYATVGKELGNFHILATAGYEFPAESGNSNTDFFNFNLHVDRKMIGWLYPLVEFNLNVYPGTAPFDLPTRRGYIDLNNFSASGNILTLAAGFNAVLIPSKLEFGAVYTTPIATQRDFNFNGLLVKMVYRY